MGFPKFSNIALLNISMSVLHDQWRPCHYSIGPPSAPEVCLKNLGSSPGSDSTSGHMYDNLLITESYCPGFEFFDDETMINTDKQWQTNK